MYPEEVKEFFIYGGELVNELPSRESRDAIRDAQKPAVAKAAKIQKKAALVASKEEEAKKEAVAKKTKKKKIRSKDQKNKGARRKPTEKKLSE